MHYVSIKFDALEIARGHDGFMRGKPEPVVILAAYATNGEAGRVLGRSLHRFRPDGAFPTTVSSLDPAITQAVGFDGELTYVILAIALEEDGGVDVERVYGATEAFSELVVWSADQDEIDPLHILDVSKTNWHYPTRVHLT